MRSLARCTAALIAMGIALAPGGAAHATPDYSLGATLQRAGAASPTNGVLTVRESTVDVEGLHIQIKGAGRPEAKGARQIWSAPGLQHVGQRTTHGVQLLSVLDSEVSPSRVSYDFVGHKLSLMPDGTVTVVEQTGSKAEKIVALIEKPWAKDATGRSVSTRYEAKGSVLTQVVKTTKSTVFPVVADPRVTKRWFGWQVQFYRSETRTIAYGAAACTGFLSRVPPPVSYVAAFCGIVTGFASTALAFNKCLALNLYGSGTRVWNATPWYWGC